MFAYVVTYFSPVSKKDQSYQATRYHFENLVKRYGNPIIILNLIKVVIFPLIYYMSSFKFLKIQFSYILGELTHIDVVIGYFLTSFMLYFCQNKIKVI